MRIEYNTITGTYFYEIPDFYLVDGEKKQLQKIAYERDLYGADTPYLGETIFIFTDGTEALERDCIPVD